MKHWSFLSLKRQKKEDKEKHLKRKKKKKSLWKIFSFLVNLRRLPGGCCRVTSTLLHGPRAADSPAEGSLPLHSAQTQQRGGAYKLKLFYVFFFLFYCLMLQSCDTTGRRTESEKYNQRGPGRLICCRLTSHLIALKYPHAYSREEEKKQQTRKNKDPSSSFSLINF